MKSVRICVLLLLACSGLAWADPGGTDDDGCHIDQQTGQYHCH